MISLLSVQRRQHSLGQSRAVRPREWKGAQKRSPDLRVESFLEFPARAKEPRLNR
jgi:hypothetical protein